MSAQDVFAPIRWAFSVPPILRADGQVDDTAHHVLLGLATFADPDGSNVRPSSAAIARRVYKSDGTVQKAIRRIESAGLIVREGTVNGCSLWRLRMDIVGSGAAQSDAEMRRDARRAANAERQRRFREKQAEQRRVTPPESVTEDDRNAPGERYVTPPESVSNAPGGRYVTPPRVQNQPIDQPETNPKTNHAPEGADGGGGFPGMPEAEKPQAVPKPKSPRRSSKPDPVDADDPRFAAFWAEYPKKTGKKPARQAFAAALLEASVEEIVAGARRRADYHERTGKDVSYCPDPTTYLNQARWEDELPEGRHLRAVSGGFTPYTNPTDPSVYEGPL